MINQDEAENLIARFYCGQHYPCWTTEMKEKICTVLHAYAKGHLIDYRYVKQNTKENNYD